MKTMMIEAHPVLHYLCIFVMFNVGLLMNVLVGAHLTTSSANNGVKNVGQYFRLRWIPLTVRWTTAIFIFLMGYNTMSNGFEHLLPSFSGHLGGAGFIGFGIDEFAAKVTALVGLQKELPAIPVVIPDATQAPHS